MSDCIFCQVVSGSIPSDSVYQDDTVMVIKDIHPQAPVHWLVISKKHIPQLTEAGDDTIAHMMSTVKKVILEQGIQGYRVVNNGAGAALIDHIHFHVLGRVDKNRQL